MAQDNWKNDTNETEFQKREGPILCANNCGFFGSSVTHNLCSKCYRDLTMKQQLETPLAPSMEKSPSVASSSSAKVEIELVKEETANSGKTCVDIVDKNQSEEQLNKKSSNRCTLCSKRVGLTGFKCRCGGTFCSTHRYSETHDCSLDYKSIGKEVIAKSNPAVKADKIEKM
ncbi:uncharacterized protein A4U43_C07F33240 [Asparagus officinalis]|uniref:AN1-type domain-containing protein n=1 Tax=Asparagus officinalis TaxID=4686 RepID=A0A5P1EGN8_ASPOF|nr:zinc finger A20 and AN1 domain-containing stress-associated protein 6-like [Asparagus officinalis]XP_020274451.1 zinc finger A20 and AN1 domain-containing stress-associated protein 6-like [Asparagus officinalis]ONK65065.1 uncharacterized protein A4U43_C07F33240 [Asparagus officinalis]